MAARDVRHACQDLVEILGDDIPKSEPLAATQDRILVVDDVADVAEMVAAVLENAGFEVVTATNGLEGLLAAHRSRPTVILMDLQMPVLDGIETTRLLKAAATTRHIPVIAHTARPDSCHVPPEQLFAHVLPKPVIPEVLLALVQRFVRN
jgi:CheY-like chemotaxis protein